MLKVQDLSVKTIAKPKKLILKGVNFELQSNKIYALIGANGSGKSTLAKAIMGWSKENEPELEIENGKILYTLNSSNKPSEVLDVTDIEPDQRAKLGIFLTYQHPVEIPFVPCINFLKEAKNQIQTHNGLKELTFSEVITEVKHLVNLLNLPSDYIHRGLNEGLSGGEKKRSEILQMLFFNPSFVILDEIDSGLDSQGLEIISTLIQNFLNPSKTILIISHQNKIFDFLKPFKTFKMEELNQI
jgi:Fe-S cluster assembly ATP-binding protein